MERDIVVFADKLKFLMTLTATTNSQLAQALNVDPSLISRFKSGTRKVSEKTDYYYEMAYYFAAKCNTYYQKNAVAEMMGTDIVSSGESLSRSIESWFTSDISPEEYKTKTMLSGIETQGETPSYSCVSRAEPQINAAENGRCFVFHGTKGKMDAMRLYNKAIQASKIVGTTKFLTQESVDWLWKNPANSKEINAFLGEIIKKGFKIIRIVPSNYSLSMACDAVKRWLPFYFTGNVESYYYPDLRDGVFNHTLYVAPGIAAMYSFSIGKEANEDTTFVTTDVEMVAAFDRKFDDYLALCVPAASMYTFPQDAVEMTKRKNEFLDCREDCIYFLHTLPMYSTPTNLLYDFVDTNDQEAVASVERKIERYNMIMGSIIKNLEGHKMTDVFKLESPEDVLNGKAVFFAYCNFSKSVKYYTPEQYIAHLKRIYWMLENFPNYNVYLSEPEMQGICAMVKKRNQILFVFQKPEFSVYQIKYSPLVSAYWEYVNQQLKPEVSERVHRKEVMSRMRVLIRQIERGLKDS